MDNNLNIPYPNVEVLNQKIEEHTLTAHKYVKEGNRQQAIIYRNKVIELYEIKSNLFGLEKDEKHALKILKLLKRGQDSNVLKNRLLKIMRRTE